MPILPEPELSEYLGELFFPSDIIHEIEFSSFKFWGLSTFSAKGTD